MCVYDLWSWPVWASVSCSSKSRAWHCCRLPVCTDVFFLAAMQKFFRSDLGVTRKDLPQKVITQLTET